MGEAAVRVRSQWRLRGLFFAENINVYCFSGVLWPITGDTNSMDKLGNGMSQIGNSIVDIKLHCAGHRCWYLADRSWVCVLLTMFLRGCDSMAAWKASLICQKPQ